MIYYLYKLNSGQFFKTYTCIVFLEHNFLILRNYHRFISEWLRKWRLIFHRTHIQIQQIKYVETDVWASTFQNRIRLYVCILCQRFLGGHNDIAFPHLQIFSTPIPARIYLNLFQGAQSKHHSSKSNICPISFLKEAIFAMTTKRTVPIAPYPSAMILVFG